jgi:hypothetical protein
MIEIAKVAADGFSRAVGYAAVREPTPLRGEDEFILDVKLYTQLNSYSCAAAAGFTVVKSFFPAKRFEDFYALVQPDPDLGVSPTRLVRALRESGVAVKRCSRLSYRALSGHIRQGRPVIVSIHNPRSDAGHWVVAYGFGSKHIVLGSNGVPLFHQKRVSREKFMQIWA